jgi:hypothetical protein
VLVAPRLDHVRHVGYPRAEDERQPRGLDGLLVGRRDHASVGHDRDISQLVGIHERTDGRQHRSGLAPVALERVNHQRKPACVGEQPDRDLRLQAAFFGEPGLTEPVPGIGLEVQGGHIVENQ